LKVMTKQTHRELEIDRLLFNFLFIGTQALSNYIRSILTTVLLKLD
jgi:hypothetical protein